MARNRKSNGNEGKRVTRYTYDEIKEPRTPETGHRALLPTDEQVVTLPMDNGWSKAIKVGKLPEGDERPVVLDMDPAAAEKEPQAQQGHLFADIEKTLRETDRSKRVEFYTYEEGWKNKLISGMGDVVKLFKK